LIRQRDKTPYGEIDLLVETPKGDWLMVEVKTLSKWDRLEHRLSFRQRQRLRRARFYIESQSGRSVIAKTAYVGPAGKILFLDT
jgi:Holliday junction resolvase-like predicted endonuclease